MQMPPRDIDSAFRVARGSRANTVVNTFSSRKFKTFLFAARKRLRREGESLASELFLNENLTLYNFALLKLLKSERKRRVDANIESFTSVFSFDGKIYVRRGADSENLHIKSRESYEAFINSLDSSNSSGRAANRK